MLPERVFLVLACVFVLGGCGAKTIPLHDSADGPVSLQLTPAASNHSLHFKGEMEGGALGFGPSVTIEAWVRSDLWLRADLRYQDEDGAPGHEVLVWGPDSAVLFDRRKGRFTELGDHPGEVEIHEGSFYVWHALWLALAHWTGPELSAQRVQGDRWQARDGAMGIRARLGRDRAKELELVWRGERLRAVPKSWTETSWGAIPRETELQGSFLDAPAQLRWSVEEIPVFADSLLDPLMLP